MSGRVQTRGVIYRESTLLCRAPSVTHRTLLGKPQRTWWFIYIKQPERSLQVLHGDGIVRLQPSKTRPHQQKCLLDSGRGASKSNSAFASLYKLWQISSSVPALTSSIGFLMAAWTQRGQQALELSGVGSLWPCFQQQSSTAEGHTGDGRAESQRLCITRLLHVA